MGNCLNKESTADQWGGEEWDEFLINSKPSKSSTPAAAPSSETESRRRSDNKCKKVEVFGEGCDEEGEEEQEKKESSKQVRIRISKKQLDVLLGKVELLGSLKVHEMMSLFINGLEEEEEEDDGQKAWRPVLKTIPELCDFNQE